jgi:hypothetical protein
MTHSIATLKALADPTLRWTKIKLNWTQALLTKAELKKLPAIKATEGQGLEAKAIVHFFGGPVDFWASEFNPEAGEFFGLFKLGNNEPELGYVSAEQLCTTFYPVTLRGSASSRTFKMPLERDLYWNPVALSECGRK